MHQAERGKVNLLSLQRWPVYQSAGDAQHDHGDDGNFPASEAVGEPTEKVSGEQVTATVRNENGAQLPALHN